MSSGYMVSRRPLAALPEPSDFHDNVDRRYPGYLFSSAGRLDLPPDTDAVVVWEIPAGFRWRRLPPQYFAAYRRAWEEGAAYPLAIQVKESRDAEFFGYERIPEPFEESQAAESVRRAELALAWDAERNLLVEWADTDVSRTPAVIWKGRESEVPVVIAPGLPPRLRPALATICVLRLLTAQEVAAVWRCVTGRPPSSADVSRALRWLEEKRLVRPASPERTAAFRTARGSLRGPGGEVYSTAPSVLRDRVWGEPKDPTPFGRDGILPGHVESLLGCWNDEVEELREMGLRSV